MENGNVRSGFFKQKQYFLQKSILVHGFQTYLYNFCFGSFEHVTAITVLFEALLERSWNTGKLNDLPTQTVSL